MNYTSPPDRTRRQGVEASSIVLADGNRWGFALPTPRLRPEIVEGVDCLGRPSQSIRLVSEYGYPLEIRRHTDLLRSACERGEPDRQFEALIRLAAALLCRAHVIEVAEAVTLLEIAEDELPAFVEAVLSIISGNCPGGSDSVRKGEIVD